MPTLRLTPTLVSTTRGTSDYHRPRVSIPTLVCPRVSAYVREPISVGSYVCTRRTLPGPVALLGPNLRPNGVFH